MTKNTSYITAAIVVIAFILLSIYAIAMSGQPKSDTVNINPTPQTSYTTLSVEPTLEVRQDNCDEIFTKAYIQEFEMTYDSCYWNLENAVVDIPNTASAKSFELNLKHEDATLNLSMKPVITFDGTGTMSCSSLPIVQVSDRVLRVTIENNQYLYIRDDSVHLRGDEGFTQALSNVQEYSNFSSSVAVNKNNITFCGATDQSFVTKFVSSDELPIYDPQYLQNEFYAPITITLAANSTEEIEEADEVVINLETGVND